MLDTHLSNKSVSSTSITYSTSLTVVLMGNTEKTFTNEVADLEDGLPKALILFTVFDGVDEARDIEKLTCNPVEVVELNKFRNLDTCSLRPLVLVLISATSFTKTSAIVDASVDFTIPSLNRVSLNCDMLEIGSTKFAAIV